MASPIHTVRLAARSLFARPGFTALAVLVLALGIGANTAMFSLVDAFLFKPLAIRDADRIVGLYSKDTKRPDTYRAFSYAEYDEIRRENDVFASLAAHNFVMVGLGEGEATRRAFADLVSGNYFETMGMPLARGRTFSAEEERPGSALPVAILSHLYWKKNGDGADPLGATLRINGRPFTVVGVAAEGFTGTTALISPDVFLPFGMYEAVANDFDNRGHALAEREERTLIVIGRLRAGVDLATADARLTTTAARLERPLPGDADQALIVRPLSRLSVSTAPTDDRELRVPSILLLSLSAIVLLIAALNVANMVLARASSRRKETAIRMALGAGRSHIVWQGLTEGAVLALLGGALGLAFASWGTVLLVRSLSAIAPIQLVFSSTPDPRVLVATFAFCLLATLLFSLGPALGSSRPGMTAQLKSDDQTGTEGGRGRRLWSRRNLLVIGQLSLSLMLLSIAGLFVRSAVKAARFDPGFRLDRGAIVEVDPSLAGYDEVRGAAVTREAVERLRALPGIASASVAGTVPFGMVSLGRSIQRASDPPADARDPAKKDSVVSCSSNIIGSDYFETLGIRMLSGRGFREAELRPGSPGVAVLDELAAKKLWPRGDALGRRIRLVSAEPGEVGREAEVVGIVANVRQHLLGERATPLVFVPFGQERQSNVHLHVAFAPLDRAAEGRLLATIRKELRAVDPRLPVLSIRTLRDHLDASFDLWIVRTAARMFLLFGVVALLLAAVGLYGVRAYAVARRTREIGIRMAIGASARDALGLVLREGMALAAIGAGIGLALSLAVGRLVAGMLHEVSGADPYVFSLAPLLLTLVALLACYVPASRAARVQPMVALRGE